MRRVLAVAAILAVAGGGAVTGFLIARSRTEGIVTAPSIPTREVTVIRTDLIQQERLAGTLRYSNPRPLVVATAGTLTALAEEATEVNRGDAIFEIDGIPVIVMFGERPAWRLFAEGMDDGIDVLQLEENLAALGHGDDLTVDQTFDGATAQAIEAWRDETGLPVAAFVELGRIVFQPGSMRVGSHLLELGSPVLPGTPVVEVSDVGQEVLVELDPNDIDLVDEGVVAMVFLPDDRRLEGQIARVGRVVRPAGPEGRNRVVEVIVALPAPVLDLDQSPVDVEVAGEAARAVLAVPIDALLALADGGYALEMRRGESTVLVGVETGAFAGGMVEVTGEIAEGDVVVVPR
jgi:hypothetical protein